jgi:hypothetical protein
MGLLRRCEARGARAAPTRPRPRRVDAALAQALWEPVQPAIDLPQGFSEQIAA